MDRATERLPLWILLAVLGAATLVGEVALFASGLGAYALAVLPVTVGAGLAYLLWKAPASRVSAPADEPFDDPVEEAARADASGLTLETGAANPSESEPEMGAVAP